ncbi:hypothetical protein O181_000665 [Austropuccinia psidii MF-1]|uniref:Uncharacterized protein n=1 Tax=Austropuccinia psidii MF-1 TaxID=1389203 RepID=A0A9Q3B9G4_9BASI|nr:hypothetical protein [Austropuccinia psidii MF-1]
MLQKGWNPRLPEDTQRKDLMHIHPTPSSFKIMLDKVKHHKKSISTLNSKNIKEPRKLKYSYVGPSFIASLHVTNSFQVELSGEMKDKHITFPVSLIKPYQPADEELLPLRNPTPLTVAPVKQNEQKNIKKFIKKGESGVRIKENILSDIKI